MIISFLCCYQFVIYVIEIYENYGTRSEIIDIDTYKKKNPVEVSIKKSCVETTVPKIPQITEVSDYISNQNSNESFSDYESEATLTKADEKVETSSVVHSRRPPAIRTDLATPFEFDSESLSPLSDSADPVITSSDVIATPEFLRDKVVPDNRNVGDLASNINMEPTSTEKVSPKFHSRRPPAIRTKNLIQPLGDGVTPIADWYNNTTSAVDNTTKVSKKPTNTP